MSSLGMDTKKVVSAGTETPEAAGKRVGEAVAEAMKAASSGLVMPRHNKDVATEKKITVWLDGSTSGDISKLVEEATNKEAGLRIGKALGAITNSLPNKLEINKAESTENILESAKKLSIFGGTVDIIPEPAMTNKQDKNEALANEITKSAIKGLLSGVDPVIEKIMEDAKKHPGLNK
jgi:hypothetical protein